MAYLFFYFPIFYLYCSRQKSIKKFLSWCVVYLIPVCALGMIQSSVSLNNLIICLLGVILIYDFYEIGYIQNDAETIKSEVNPSLRLSERQLSYYESHKIAIYSLRLLLGCVLSYFLFKISPQPQFFLVCVFSLLLIYQIYNRIRSRWNLFLHIFLISIRFCSVQLLFWPDIDWSVLICSFFMYPFANILERASFPKYGIQMMRFLIGGKDKIVSFRIKYYVIALLAVLILAFTVDTFDIRLCYLFVYYLIVRILFGLLGPKTETMFVYFK